ncbi:MAG TPA: penicillin acylase family protein, partial [Thermopetrobacter sp.]|nr:penicillin acylase family protein [Thermopetrobacter sp.]
MKTAGRFPTPEFYTLMLPRPDPFSPVDSVAWLKMMAWDLGGNWRHELERLRLAAKMPMRRVFEVKPPYPGETAPKLPELRDLYGFPLKVATGPLLDEKRFAAIIRDNGAAGVGSNNWVLAPSRTTSGRAILANDPHLNLTTPSVWYYLRVSVPEENFDVIGATLPGVPFVVLGRNRHLAWGFTNTGPDVQDLFVERLSDRPGHYDAPDGPKPFVTRTETIRVRFGRDVTITVRETRHGPVISDALPAVAKLFGGRAVLAFQWTALLKTDGTISALRRLGAVKSLEKFKDNARGFVAPQQNIVYADMQGNIGYIAPGKVPLRKKENPLRGLLPAPGWDAAYDWAGFIPFEELPQVVNPPSGVIITANQKVVGPDYPHFITGDWTLPYRYDRIRALIEERRKHDVESVKRIQTDVTSLFVRDLLPVMLKHIAGMEEFAAVRALLSEWDGAARADGAEMLIFAVWHDRLLEMVLREEHPNPTRKNRLKPRFLKNVLTNLNGQGVWCANALKDTSTDKCPQLVAEALRVALADIRGQFGDDMRNWRWGEAHAAVFEHRPLGRFPLFDKWFNVRVERNGGPHTVNVSNYKTPRMGLEFATTHAASLRHIFEMGQGGANLFIF